MRYLLRLSTLESVQNLARDPINVFPAARRASMLYFSLREYEMHLPNYLKCSVKVTNPPINLMIVVYMQLVYSLASRVHLFFSLSFFWRVKEELMR